jgi:hypothetical protein
MRKMGTGKVDNRILPFKVGDRVNYITRGASSYFGCILTSSGNGVIEKVLRDSHCTMYKVRENGYSIMCTSSQIVKMA